MKDECRQAIAQAYLFIDGEVLTVEERFVVRQHLQDCAPCFERVGLDAEVTHLIARLKGTERCPGKLKERIQSLLESS